MQNILRLSPIDSASPTPVPRRGRKRRLVFADDSTQLSKKDIRHNMETVGELNRKEVRTVKVGYYTLVQVLMSLHWGMFADRFSVKCEKIIPKLRLLW